jgi:hypothetical protein
MGWCLLQDASLGHFCFGKCYRPRASAIQALSQCFILTTPLPLRLSSLWPSIRPHLWLSVPSLIGLTNTNALHNCYCRRLHRDCQQCLEEALGPGSRVARQLAPPPPHTHTCGTQVVLSYNVSRLYAPLHTHARTYPPALTCNHKAPLPLSPPDLV